MADGLPPEIQDGTVTLSFTFTNNSGTPRSSGYYYGYCTIANTKFEFTNLAQMPTLSNSVIAEEVCYAGQSIQEALDRAYQMPYGGTSQMVLRLLQLLNQREAAGNIIDRYFTGGSPNKSAHADRLHQWVFEQITAIEAGMVRLDAPFGDAIARGDLPVYPHARAFTGAPSAFSGASSQAPIFTLDTPRFRKESTF